MKNRSLRTNRQGSGTHTSWHVSTQLVPSPAAPAGTAPPAHRVTHCCEQAVPPKGCRRQLEKSAEQHSRGPRLDPIGRRGKDISMSTSSLALWSIARTRTRSSSPTCTALLRNATSAASADTDPASCMASAGAIDTMVGGCFTSTYTQRFGKNSSLSFEGSFGSLGQRAPMGSTVQACSPSSRGTSSFFAMPRKQILSCSMGANALTLNLIVR
mmetsp:Transcript_37176/g.87171  ORF Transcript_37176/g.87171 Transcript_37176/m.87171 type:complete len:213 (-) Transcript_37176:468-1106(-)